jgi:hypothetical protein
VAALDIALNYINRGWNPVPVDYRAKKPRAGNGWQLRIIDATNAPDYFNDGQMNIGVILGPSSHGLTDVDLDCDEARTVAPYILPRTGAIFGRASSRAAHWLYYTDLSVDADKAVLVFNDPKTNERLLELRIGGASGAQTVFPGSTHETGETITWEENGEPASVDNDDLYCLVHDLAAYSLIARYWPARGLKTRHNAALIVGGFLARAGMVTQEIKVVAEAIARAANDKEWRNRREAAEDAAKAFHAGKHAYGITGMRKQFGDAVADQVAEWLGYDDGGSEPTAAGGTADEPPPVTNPDKYGISNNRPQSAEPEIDLAKTFTFLGDAPHAAPRELINGLIPAEGVAVTGGQSTAGKTFVGIYKSICLATATPYFGRKIVERVGTVFVAAEGRPLLPNRFAATLIKLSIEAKLPITWPNMLPDFSCAAGIKLFVRQLKAIDERYRGDFGVRLGHVPIDTVAATFGMKDEDDNAEATKVCNILRSIGDETGALMAPVHHYGKNPESGLRGASAWKGSADVIEGVLADIDPLTGRTSNRELVCTKARDGEQGPISPFDLEFIELGLKDDGEIYGSCCVVPSTREQSRFGAIRGQSKSQRAILSAINEAIDSAAKIIVPRTGMPQVRAAKVNDIRKEFDRLYVVDGDDPVKVEKAKQKAFRRAIDWLAPTKFGAGSCEGADWIWKI